jgi:hypothetical protein
MDFDAALKVANATDTQPGSLGQICLGQSGGEAKAAQ